LVATTTRASARSARLAADAVVLLVLQDLEQLGLERRVHLADLVEEDGPLVGELELAPASRWSLR